MSAIENLVDRFKKMPGIGPKSAQRIVYYILEHNKESGLLLSDSLKEAVDSVRHCEMCNTLTEDVICPICSNSKRNNSILCIVETPSDLNAIEQVQVFDGLYFVLGGHLSPIDGIGPKDIGLDKLSDRLNSGQIAEVIIATNPTIEGEATAHYISNIISVENVKYSRIARGIPVGGELEYIDGNTISRAFAGRILLDLGD